MTIADEEDDEGEEDSDRVRSGFALLLHFDAAMNMDEYQSNKSSEKSYFDHG